MVSRIGAFLPRKAVRSLAKRWGRIRRTLRPGDGGRPAEFERRARSSEMRPKKDSKEPIAFAYRRPAANASVKQVVRLARTEIMRAAIHVVGAEGGESLHLHEGQDGFWMVLSGRARFHGENGVVHGEFGPHEGILIPRECAYWFESIGDCDLELLQFLAFDRRGPVARRNLEPRRLDDQRVEKYDGRSTA